MICLALHWTDTAVGLEAKDSGQLWVQAAQSKVEEANKEHPLHDLALLVRPRIMNDDW